MTEKDYNQTYEKEEMIGETKMSNQKVVITNNNPKEIVVKSIYDEKFDVIRVNVKLKRKIKNE